MIKQECIARPELFEALRNIGIEQLGEVERPYLEPSGQISAFSNQSIISAQDCPCCRRVLKANSAPTVPERRFGSAAPMLAGSAVMLLISFLESHSKRVLPAAVNDGQGPSSTYMKP